MRETIAEYFFGEDALPDTLDRMQGVERTKSGVRSTIWRCIPKGKADPKSRKTAVGIEFIAFVLSQPTLKSKDMFRAFISHLGSQKEAVFDAFAKQIANRSKDHILTAHQSAANSSSGPWLREIQLAYIENYLPYEQELLQSKSSKVLKPIQQRILHIERRIPDECVSLEEYEPGVPYFATVSSYKGAFSCFIALPKQGTWFGKPEGFKYVAFDPNCGFLASKSIDPIADLVQPDYDEMSFKNFYVIQYYRY